MPGREQRALELRRQRRRGHPASDRIAAARQLRDIVDIQARQFGLDALRQAAVREKFPECIRGGGEAGWDADPEPAQMADHLAQRGVLAANALDITHAELMIRYHVVAQCPSPEAAW